MKFTVSVIVPVFNMEKYLGKCLESIVSQTLNSVQIICIDDGSTDHSCKILEEYKSIHSNIIVLHQDRQGPGKARNKGLEYAEGKFVAFMDSDDYYAANDSLEALYNYAISHDIKAVGGNILRDLEGKISDNLGGYFRKIRFTQNDVINFSEYQFCWGYTCFIFDREMVIQNNIAFPSYIRGQDPPFMLRALSCAGKMGVVAKDIYVARAFDKKVKYNSINVINDMARCYYDIITFSLRNNYMRLVETGFRDLERWKIYFFLHMVNGNTELQDVFHELNAKIMDVNYMKPNGYFLDMSLENVKDYLEKYSQKVGAYICRMEEYQEIIVYGAGQLGKLVYDVIETRCPEKFVGFAVSDKTPKGKARGKKISCIDSFLNRKNCALVIIAGLPNISGQMEKMAEELGFVNRLVIQEEIFDVENYEIVNDKFAV